MLASSSISTPSNCAFAVAMMGCLAPVERIAATALSRDERHSLEAAPTSNKTLGLLRNCVAALLQKPLGAAVERTTVISIRLAASTTFARAGKKAGLSAPAASIGRRTAFMLKRRRMALRDVAV